MKRLLLFSFLFLLCNSASAAWTEKYVRADAAGGGTGNSDTAVDAYQLSEAITHSTTNTNVRYNVRAGTYTFTTTTHTFSGVGLTTAPNWWRGFSATPGDLDTDYSTTRPLWSYTTGRVVISGAHQIFSNINIESQSTTVNAGAVNVTAAAIRLDRMRFTNTAANANSTALRTATGGDVVVTRCWFTATSTATQVCTIAARTYFVGCVIRGGGNGIDINTNLIAMYCVFDDVGGSGINISNTSAAVTAINCIFYSAGNDGIRVAAAPNGGIIAYCIFDANGGYGINNNTGANINTLQRFQNAYHNNTSGQTNGFSDQLMVGPITETASPFTNAAGRDFTMVPTAQSRGSTLPGNFDNETYSPYIDLGAVPRKENDNQGFILIGF